MEVVSAGAENRQRDFEAKRDLYFRRGAREYWIVDLERSEVHRLMRRGEAWEALVLRDADRLSTPLVPDWAGISVGELLGA